MPEPPLNNYLRRKRKENGFSQEEVAYLIASGDGAKISRYENFKQQPNLETGLGLAFLFRTPTRLMFMGVSAKVERRIIQRTKAMLRKLEKTEQDRATMHKMQFLRSLCSQLGQLRCQSG